MQDVLRSFFALCALTTLLISCGSDKSPANTGVSGFDAPRAMKDVQELASNIGPRPSGSEEAKAAADYIVEQFGGSRFGVVRIEYTYEIDPNRLASIDIGGSTVVAVTAGGSKTARASGVAVPVGEAAEFAPGSLSGKVAVATRGGSSFREKYEAARAAGAAALIIANTEPGELVANLGITAAIPVVSVNSDGAMALDAAIAAGSVVTVEVTPPQLGEGTNIVARSATAHACVFFVMANYDSAAGSPGANDEASGIAVMLELARQFASRDKLPAVCFIAMDGGASGGTGVSDYVNSLRTAAQPATVIDLHAIGAGGPLMVSGETTLVSDAVEIAGEFGISAQAVSSLPFASDLGYFTAPGVGTLQVFRDGAPSSPDVVASVKPANLREVGLIVGELLTRISTIVRR